MTRLPVLVGRTVVVVGLCTGAWSATAQHAPGRVVEVGVLTPFYDPVFDVATFAPADQRVNGLAAGTQAGATAQVGTGLLARPATGNPALPDLVASIDLDGATGRGRMTAFGDLPGEAGATVHHYDTLTRAPGAAPLPVTVRVNLQAFSATGLGSEARFFVGLSAWDGADYGFNLFGFGGTVTATAQGSTSSGLLFTPQGGQQLAQVPMAMDVAFVVPAQLGPTLHLRWDLSAGVTGVFGGQAAVGAGQSAWLGIAGDYTSAGGYSYPGASAPVPEPSRALLLAAGVLVVCARRRARRAGPA